MKNHALLGIALALTLFSVAAPQADAFVYFGGKVTDWQEQTTCPPIVAANTFLDAVCGFTAGVVCLDLEYGKLSLQGGFAKPNALTASFKDKINIGVLQLKDRDVPMFPLHFFQSFLNYGFTQTNSWSMGEAVDFTPTCNPCANDIERKVLGMAGVNMDKMCNNFVIKATLSAATRACDAAVASSTQSFDNMCPLKSLCFVGTSHFGLPSVEFNLCHPGFSIGGFRL